MPRARVQGKEIMPIWGTAKSRKKKGLMRVCSDINDALRSSGIVWSSSSEEEEDEDGGADDDVGEGPEQHERKAGGARRRRAQNHPPAAPTNTDDARCRLLAEKRAVEAQLAQQLAALERRKAQLAVSATAASTTSAAPNTQQSSNNTTPAFAKEFERATSTKEEWRRAIDAFNNSFMATPAQRSAAATATSAPRKVATPSNPQVRMKLALWSAESGYGTLRRGAAAFVQKSWRGHRDRERFLEHQAEVQRKQQQQQEQRELARADEERRLQWTNSAAALLQRSWRQAAKARKDRQEAQEAVAQAQEANKWRQRRREFAAREIQRCFRAFAAFHRERRKDRRAQLTASTQAVSAAQSLAAAFVRDQVQKGALFRSRRGTSKLSNEVRAQLALCESCGVEMQPRGTACMNETVPCPTQVCPRTMPTSVLTYLRTRACLPFLDLPVPSFVWQGRG